MRISHKHKFIFIAVPRTASTTCRMILDNYSDIKSIHKSEVNDSFPFYHHISAKEVKKIFNKNGWMWDEYKKFCLIRNPFDRVVSLYHYKLEGRGRKRSLFSNLSEYVEAIYKPELNFSDFVMNLKLESKMHAPITRYILDYDGSTLVDDILLYENFDTELPRYLSQLGMKIDKKSITLNNATNKKDNYRDYYDSQELIDIVSDIYSFEIEKFNYKF